MHSPGINGELRGQPANPGSPGKMAVKTECVCVYSKTAIKYCTLSGVSYTKAEAKQSTLQLTIQ